jgi:uncharacterized protein (TIGR02996 family)
MTTAKLTSTRDALVPHVRENPDDVTAWSALADWCQEHGTLGDDGRPLHARIRFCLRAMEAIRAVQAECPPASIEERKAAYLELADHPSRHLLLALAAADFCRRPCVWNRLPKYPEGRLAATAQLLFAFGVVPWPEVVTAKRAAGRAARKSSPVNSLALTAAASETVVNTAAYASYAARLVSNNTEEAERGYHAAVYRALAAMQPMDAE